MKIIVSEELGGKVKIEFQRDDSSRSELLSVPDAKALHVKLGAILAGK